MKVIYIILILMSILSLGCSKTLSDNINTTAFYITYRLSGNNAGTASCTVSFQVGGSTGTYIDLSNSDTVTCDGQAMTRNELLGIVTYTAAVPYSVGKIYNLVLNRSTEGVYTSTAVLPNEIVGYSPAANSTIQKGSVINLFWNSSGSGVDSMSAYLNYTAGASNYSYYKHDSAPENGSLVFPSYETQVIPTVSGSWSATIRYYRSQSGQVDPAFSGTALGEQQVQVNFTLID